MTESNSKAASLCWVFCCPPCPSSIANKMAFAPPVPTYSIKQDSTGEKEILVLNKRAEWQFSEKHKEAIEVSYTRTSRGNKIACMFVRCSPNARFTILHSHGNAVDLGQMSSFYMGLGSRINCNIFSYDYSGYGASSGNSSEKNLYADIKSAWEQLTTKYEIFPSNVILYGQSIGTAPTIDLASKFEVAGVVLHSGLTSGLRLINPKMTRSCILDQLNSIDKVPKISSPVLVIHGTEDEVIDFSHGLAIYEKCPRAVDPLWVEGAGHNDVELYNQYLERLRHFVNQELTNCHTASSSSSSDNHAAATATTVTLSTQNNHKHNAQVNISHSTEKNVDSSKEKAKNNGLSKKAAASKAVSEVDAIQTKSSLQSSVSENNFDTKLKNNARVEGKSSKHKTVDTDGIQFLIANKPHGKTGSCANSNLKCGAIEKTFAPVSAVRSLNSPIHQKPQPISDKITPEVDFSHTASLYQPPLTNSSVHHAKRMDLVPLSKSKANEKEIELKDNQEGEPFFHIQEESGLDDQKLSCKVVLPFENAGHDNLIHQSPINSNEDSTKKSDQECDPMQEHDVRADESAITDVTPSDINGASDEGKIYLSKDGIEPKCRDDQSDVLKADFHSASDSCEILDKSKGEFSALPAGNTDAMQHPVNTNHLSTDFPA